MVSSGEVVEIIEKEPAQNEINIAESRNSSDTEQDQIEKLKAEHRLNGTTTINGNGNHDSINGGDNHHNDDGESKENGRVVTINDDENDDDDEKHKKTAEKNTNNDEVQASTSTATTTVSTGESEKKLDDNSEVANGKTGKREVECIELDDDEEDDKEPPSKKIRVEECETKKEEDKVQISSAERLLDQLEEYVSTALATNNTVNRKILDALLGAINLQVQREPLSVRKLILDKQLVLPNTISFPPSQTIDLLIEHDPDYPIGKVINKMFGEERPKLSETERKEKATLKASNPVPHMTKLLMDIGQDLVQESTYCDIVHAKNLPETPKNVETYKQVAQQLKPVWETLKRKNEPYKLKMRRCGLCGFQTESNLVMSSHKATIHVYNNKFHCAFCKEYDNNEQRMKDHYFEAHLVIAKSEEKESKYPCVICEEDFNFKGVREQHFKQCKKDYIRVRHMMAPKQDDLLHINRWLWEKPPIDPTILAQQQQVQEQQLKKQKLQQAQQYQALQKKQLLAQQQQQHQQLMKHQQQAQLRQMAQLMQSAQARGGNILNNNTLIAAMQAQIRNRNANAGTLAATLLQKSMANHGSSKSPVGAAAIQAAAAAALRNQKTPIASSSSSSAAATKGSSGLVTKQSSPSPSITLGVSAQQCEICDQTVPDKEKYLYHLQGLHKQMVGKAVQDMSQGAPLACSRCRDRFWTYEGLERHLVMSHGLVTADLLQKAQKKEDGGRCKLCGKQYAFNMLTHLVADHQVKLCSAEIMYSCDVCSFKCTSYQTLESHLSTNHPKATPIAGTDHKKAKKAADCITLDD